MSRKNSLLNKIASKMGTSVRSDIRLVHSSVLDDTTARVVATYSGTKPTLKDLQSWVIANADGNLALGKAELEYVLSHPKNMVKFCLKQNVVRKAVASVESNPGFKKISASSYFDVDLGTVWKQEEDGEGKFLVRCQPDGLSQVIASISTYEGPKTRIRAEQTLAKTVYVGDVVDYIKPDTTLGTGTITSVADECAVIKDQSTGNTFERPFAAVVRVSNDSAGRKQESQKVSEFFQEMYGEDFGKELTQ